MARVFIGTPDNPFTHNVIITLNGRRDDVPLPLSRRLTFGSKGIGVFGNVSSSLSTLNSTNKKQCSLQHVWANNLSDMQVSFLQFPM